jgi:hypothetical protein
MGKTNPLNDADLAEFIELQKTQVRGLAQELEPGRQPDIDQKHLRPLCQKPERRTRKSRTAAQPTS